MAVLLTRRLLVTSEDNFPGSDASSGRWEIGSTSLFLHSLGIRPFIDVIWTREQEEGMKGYPRGRNNIMLQAAVATLSSGPVGIGDGPGDTNTSVTTRIAAVDGTLLGPSKPATPIDAMYAPDWRGGTSHASVFYHRNPASFLMNFAIPSKQPCALCVHVADASHA